MLIKKYLLCFVGTFFINTILFAQYKDFFGYISKITPEDRIKTNCDKCVFCWKSIVDSQDDNLCKVNCRSRRVPHIFCQSCILAHLEFHKIKKCPICRSDIYSIDILLDSIELNDVQGVEQIINSGVDINSVSLDGRLAFVYACEWNRKNIAELLIRQGPDLNAQDRDGNTAFMYAVRNNHLDIVESLIRLGVDLDMQNRVGDTALICAIKFGNFNMAKLLIETERINVNMKNFENNTALICAAKYNNYNMVKLLVEIGKVDKIIVNKSGDTALDYAQMHKNLEIIKILA